MNHDYRNQFHILREEFRVFRDGATLNNKMNGTFLSEHWLSSPDPAMFDRPGIIEAETHPSASSQRETPMSSSTISSDSTPECETEVSSQLASRKQKPSSDPSDCDPIDKQLDIRESLATASSVPQKSRKGHKKSRQGCFNCKRRKIKCQENQPACDNCTKKNLECTYPAPRTLVALRGSAVYSPSPIASVNLQSTPTTFTLTDLRLFHHYLLDAYPHLPVGNDSTWLSQVPLIAHHNEYLMHAILGLAASHFELLTGEDLKATAIHHRVQAIKGSNAAISQTRRTGSDGDALLAACYCLAFQSSYMEDGLQEFFQMVRGCSLLSLQLKAESLPMAFFLTEKDHWSFMEERLFDLPTIHEELVTGAEKSLKALPPIFERPSHVQFYQVVIDCVEAVKVSSVRAYFKFVTIYQSIIKMDVETFQDFTDPTNLVSRMLIAHFLTIQIVIAPIIDREWLGRSKSTPIRIHLDWIFALCEALPPNLRIYMEWPKAVAEAAGEEIVGKQSLVPRIPISGRRRDSVRVLFN